MKSSRLLLSVGSGLFLVACGGDASLGKNATDVAGEKTGGSVTGAGGAPGTTGGSGPARRRARREHGSRWSAVEHDGRHGSRWSAVEHHGRHGSGWSAVEHDGRHGSGWSAVEHDGRQHGVGRSPSRREAAREREAPRTAQVRHAAGLPISLVRGRALASTTPTTVAPLRRGAPIAEASVCAKG